MSTATIEVRGLGKTYPDGVEAVKGIDFDVAPGEVFGLLGPNGAAGLAVRIGGRPVAVIGFSVAGGRIVEIDLVADPDKLRALT